MTNAIAPVFIDLADKELTTDGERIKPLHHNKACSCTGKCRICRCKQKKEHNGEM